MRQTATVPANVLPPLIAICFLLAGLTAPSTVWAQPDAALNAFHSARDRAVVGDNEAALQAFLLAANAAEKLDDVAVEVAALRGAADMLAMRRPCTDSAQIILQKARAAAGPDDRSASDALVRLLASRGSADAARSALVSAYSDIPNLGRAITKESMRYLQGLAAVELAGGHEAAALSNLQQSLVIAARLRQGGVGDSIAQPTGAVNELNVWVMYDLAQLRLAAKSPSIRNRKLGQSIMDMLAAAPTPVLDGGSDEPYPVTRIADRRVLSKHVQGSASVATTAGCG